MGHHTSESREQEINIDSTRTPFIPSVVDATWSSTGHSEGEDGATPHRCSLSARTLVPLVPLVIFLLVWVIMVTESAFTLGGPSGAGFSSDYSMFYTASRVLQQGANPYDHELLYRAQWRILSRQGVYPGHDRQLVRVGNPPLMLWAIGPLCRLSFRNAGWIWFALTLLVTLAGFRLSVAALRWRHWTVQAAVFLALPPTLLQVFYGNPVCFILLALGAAYFLSKTHPATAGFVLAAAWLKPTLALPLAVIVVLFVTRQSSRALFGLLVGSAAFWSLNLVAVGPVRIVQWVHGLSDYSSDIATQPEVASLPGLYVHWAPHAVSTVLGVLLVLTAGGITLLAWSRLQDARPVAPLKIAWLFAAWFLATPYAHGPDIVLLVVPLASVMGADARKIARPIPTAVLYLVVSTLLVNRLGHIPVDLAPVKLLAVAVLLAIAARRTSPRVDEPSGTLVTLPPMMRLSDV